jgi:hypothetical protein
MGFEDLFSPKETLKLVTWASAIGTQGTLRLLRRAAVNDPQEMLNFVYPEFPAVIGCGKLLDQKMNPVNSTSSNDS